jgi:hypothetical protein
MIPVYENYEGYQPPPDVRATVEKLLSNLPQHYLTDLESVVLTNGACIGRGKTRRVGGKKYVRRECLGFYHPKWKSQQAWIELVVDNIVNLRLGPQTASIIASDSSHAEFGFASTLFHEIGHHLERTIGAPTRQGEAAAEAWKNRLLRSYFWKSHSS